MNRDEIKLNFDSALNFFSTAEEVQRAIAFYSVLDEHDWKAFFRLMDRTPFEDRMEMYRRYRSSVKISDEEILEIHEKTRDKNNKSCTGLKLSEKIPDSFFT